MQRHPWTIGLLVVAIGLGATLFLTGCNTVEGAGHAVSAMGQGISEDAQAADRAIRKNGDNE